MSKSSSIEVTIWKATSIGRILPLFHSAGWRFWEDEIRYCWFREVGEEEFVGTAAPEKWEELTAGWDEQVRSGKIVEVMYQWQDHEDQQVTVWFSRKQDDQPWLTIEFIMYVAQHRLCGNITDFSWYLNRIVCPLEQNDCGVLWVTCSDDNG